MLLSEKEVDDILCFWFPNQKYNKFWFEKNDEFDTIIKNKYEDLLMKTFENIKDFNITLMNSDELVAIIILLDQFSRNINRIVHNEQNKIYSSLLENNYIFKMTEEAHRLSKYWIQKEYYLNESINKTVFALMPLRHLNKLHDYKIILEVLDKIQNNKDDEIYIKFKNQTVRRKDLLMD